MTRAERLAFEQVKRENVRLREWLRMISWRCRGLAPSLAGYATQTKTWPDGLDARHKFRSAPIADSSQSSSVIGADASEEKQT